MTFIRATTFLLVTRKNLVNANNFSSKSFSSIYHSRSCIFMVLDSRSAVFCNIESPQFYDYPEKKVFTPTLKNRFKNSYVLLPKIYYDRFAIHDLDKGVYIAKCWNILKDRVINHTLAFYLAVVRDPSNCAELFPLAVVGSTCNNIVIPVMTLDLSSL